MKKTATIMVFMALVGAGGVFAQNMTMDRVFDVCVEELTRTLPAGTRIACPRLSAADPELAEYATSQLAARLVRDTRFVVVNRDTSAVDKEIDYQLRGNVSDETAVSITQQLGAQVVIAGAVRNAGSSYRLEIRAIGVEQNNILFHWEAEGRASGAWGKFGVVKAGLRVEDANGGGFTSGEKRGVLLAVKNGTQAQKLPIELPANIRQAEQAANSEDAWYFLVTAEYEERGDLTVGTAYIEFVRNDVTICASENYHITEMGARRFLQKAADKIKDDRTFWKALDKALIQ